MTDLTQLLDGSIDDVKTGLTGKSHDDLLKLRAAEQDGKKRQGVLDALDKALSAADAERAGGFTQDAPAVGVLAVAAALDTSGPADVAPATAFSTSGAPVQVVPDVDVNSPAVDNDPRAGTTLNMNRIDFNDPHAPGHEVVERALKDQAQA